MHSGLGTATYITLCCSYYARILQHTKWIVGRNGRRSWRRPINALLIAHTWYIQRCMLRICTRDSTNYCASTLNTSTLKTLRITCSMDRQCSASFLYVYFVVQHDCCTMTVSQDLQCSWSARFSYIFHRATAWLLHVNIMNLCCIYLGQCATMPNIVVYYGYCGIP